MNIAILGIKGVPGHHGVEIVVDSLLPYLRQLGHRITVYGYHSYCSPSDNHQGIRIQTVRGSSRKNFEMISHMLLASLNTRHASFDIIHIHNMDPCLLAWLPKSRYGVVATSHGQAYVRKKWSIPVKVMSKIAERFFIRLPRLSTSVSKPLADFYMDKYKKDVLYIPNGIKFRPDPAKKYLDKWQLKAHNFLLCSAGRIERTKGIQTLIEAYAQLKPEIPLIIAGGGAGSDL